MASDEIVEFDHPPVYEAVIGFEFNQVIKLGAIKLAGLQSVWGNSYPTVHEMPSLEPSVAAGQPQPLAALRFGTGQPALRLWFIDPSSHFLIQVQRDRLLLNWRKLGDGEYPRYAALRARFIEIVEQFRNYVRLELDSVVVPTTAEYSYINRVPDGRAADTMYTVFQQPLTDLPGKVILTRFQQVRDLPASLYGAPGQVTISSDPVQDADGSAIQMAIGTKFFPRPSEFGEQTWKLLDSARSVSRETFVALATNEMKQEWGVR